MIILITGATHTGKTKLAQRLLEKHHYPYLSLDHLKMGLIRSDQTDLTPEDDDRLIAYLWPIAREMIKTAIENDQHLIVEGCYIPFTWQKDFSKSYLRSIRFICLAMTDEYIDTRYEKIAAHAGDIENRLDDSYLDKELLKRDNRLYIDGCQKHNLPLCLINDDYEEALDTLLETLIEPDQKKSSPLR